MLRTSVVVLASLALCACASRHVDVSAGEVVSTRANVLPAGEKIELRLNQKLSTEGNRVGDMFTATIVKDVTDAVGSVVVPAGSTVTGRITALANPRDVSARVPMRLRFEQITVKGLEYPFAAHLIEVVQGTSELPAKTRMTIQATRSVTLR